VSAAIGFVPVSEDLRIHAAKPCYEVVMSRFRIPAAAFAIVKEAARHLLRRPIVGIAAAARTADGRWLLVRRADMGEWALPGGTLEWGEALRASIARELAEEAGVDRCEVVRLVGVYSRPDRDPRFHGVTIVVECEIDAPVRGPSNPLEITEARLFEASELPPKLAMDMQDMLSAALRRGEPVLE
jgi:8-oxo-dGTP diphosphatase